MARAHLEKVSWSLIFSIVDCRLQDLLAEAKAAENFHAMVMEALAAVSLAAAAVQFIHFTSKVASKGCEIYQSVDGSLQEHVDIEHYANEFERSGWALAELHSGKYRSRGLSPSEKALIKVAEDCQAVCKDIQQVLWRLQNSSKVRRYTSFYKALKAVWGEEKVNVLLRRLQLLKDELFVHLLVVMESVRNAIFWD